ncbi:uncharacterized protein C9orf85 homolog isoform X2 [Pomacea canaliculata]|uniref:uncharacterized protein C9orf85 homolog isoform X2 n=1 Tax=Pomacea canaliculata TaxID=400727 RepID=UPI000D72B926|nr:uncharacterized protein C9orf85 homolog isoform X2 [Pomacea canaliculata]
MNSILPESKVAKMSSQRGNTSRARPQKHKNATGFSNTRHDTSIRTKQILQVQQTGLCGRCKEKIAWKVKYKKYKPLSQPATCTKCHQKTVKKAYYTVCQVCAERDGICAKCAQKADIVDPFEEDKQMEAAHQSQLEQELRLLTERQRRSFFRLQEQGKLKGGSTSLDDSCKDISDVQERDVLHDNEDLSDGSNDGYSSEDNEIEHIDGDNNFKEHTSKQC